MSAPNTKRRLNWRRALLATTAAISLGQNAAWATCLDGTSFPAGGYQIGKAPVKVAANWSPNVFTSTEGSVFIPDISTNDQTTGAPTGGGHNWAFDQGSTLCKLGDAGNKADHLAVDAPQQGDDERPDQWHDDAAQD